MEKKTTLAESLYDTRIKMKHHSDKRERIVMVSWTLMKGRIFKIMQLQSSEKTKVYGHLQAFMVSDRVMKGHTFVDSYRLMNRRTIMVSY